jgi:myosin heavy subunit
MGVIGISSQDQDSIFRLLAGALHIGNMGFYENEKGNAVISDPQGRMRCCLANKNRISLLCFVLRRY